MMDAGRPGAVHNGEHARWKVNVMNERIGYVWFLCIYAMGPHLREHVRVYAVCRHMIAYHFVTFTGPSCAHIALAQFARMI